MSVTIVNPFAHELKSLRDAGLTGSDLSDATGAASSTARAWLGGTRTPSGERADRLLELSAVVDLMRDALPGGPAQIPAWLRKPVPALGGDKPIELIASGEYRRVLEALSGLVYASGS